MVEKKYIILHHSLTADGSTVSWDAIRRYHVQERGWDDVGYHFGIEQIGDRYEILVGRMLTETGAHCKELAMNVVGLGICLVGNFDDAPPSGAQLVVLRKLVKSLQEVFGIQTSHVLGHREIGKLSGFDWTAGQYKSCPGRQFDLNAFRSRLS